MIRLPRDVGGAIVVGMVSVALFVAAMGSLVLLGHNTGTRMRAQKMEALRAGTFGDSGPRAAAASDRQPQQVPVLCYHYLRGRGSPLRVARVFAYVVLSLPTLGDNELWTVSHSAFESQMRYLANHGYTAISLDQLTAWQEGRATLPEKPVVITFDDGDRSIYRHAWPILERYGMRATVFVSTGHVGEKWEGIDMLDWYALREMKDSGVFDIESHSHSMHYKATTRMGTAPVFLAAEQGWTRIDGNPSWRSAVAADLARSRDLIRRHVGTESRYLAWPFGLGDAALDSVAASVGFIRTAEMMGGTNERFEANRRVTAGARTTAAEAGFVQGAGAPLPGGRYRRAEITRVAVTARTSLRDLRRILRGEPVDAR